MAEDRQFRRDVAELERRFLRPDRGDLDALARRIAHVGSAPASRVWAAAIREGVIPAGWADDPGRRFRATRGTLERGDPEALVRAEVLADEAGRASLLTAAPPSAHAALLFAADPEGVEAAEAHGRELVRRLEPWGCRPLTRIAWRLAGNPVGLSHAGGPPLRGLRSSLAHLRAALDDPMRIYEPAHAHARFQHVVDALAWSRSWREIRHYEVPAQVRGPRGVLELPAAVVGRNLAELQDPLEPWLELLRLGYQVWAMGERGESILELAAPLVPALPQVGRRDEGRRRRGPVPRVVWSQRVAKLRLACARADTGTLRRELPLLIADDEPRQPRLPHFAVYGGPEVLELLADHEGPRGEPRSLLELDARDQDERTPLMIAAALPEEGPGGAIQGEVDAPISEIVGANSCEWLLRAGADPEARDLRGWTALHWAARGRRLHCVAALIGGGAEVDARDHLGRTPLILAAESQAPLELIEALLAEGCEVDHRDHRGWTALHALAVVPGRHARAMAKRLVERGARPSRDCAGRSPADLCALRGVRHDDRGPFDPRTPVAAGPGLEPSLVERQLVEPLLSGILPDPSPGPRPWSRPRGHRIPRASLEHWSVWADWLASRGDPRGELVATSVALARASHRKRAALEGRLARLQQRLAHRFPGALLADPLAPLRPQQTPAYHNVVLTRRHGFVTAARISWPGLHAEAAAEALTAARLLLEHEPLVARLRLGVRSVNNWLFLLTSLRSIDPAAGLRELELFDLPGALPGIVDLHHRFPDLRTLSLTGAGKISAGLVDWPGIVRLRLRHGDTSEWSRGLVGLELRLPDLTHLDLALPFGGRTSDEEVAGFSKLLTQLPSLRHLRLSPLAPMFARALLRSPVLGRLRSLELDSVRGQSLELLAEAGDQLAGLEAIRVAIKPRVAAQRGVVVEQLRQRLPQLELESGREL